MNVNQEVCLPSFDFSWSSHPKDFVRRKETDAQYLNTTFMMLSRLVLRVTKKEVSFCVLTKYKFLGISFPSQRSQQRLLDLNNSPGYETDRFLSPATEYWANLQSDWFSKGVLIKKLTNWIIV